jgi:uncharacterized protein
MTPLPTRLSVVTLGARDLPRLRAFYNKLGFRVGIQDGDDFAAFLVGGVALALYPLDLLAAEAAPDVGPPEGGWSGVTLAICVDTRDDVDAAYAAAIEAGATVVGEPVDRDTGARSGYFADPEGNRWEVAWAPNMEFDDRGALTRFGPA